MTVVKTVIRDNTKAIDQRLDQALTLLLQGLASVPLQRRSGAAELSLLLAPAAEVRDLAGLVGRHLLTETAIYVSDVLDAVVYEAKGIDGTEAMVFAEALRFAHLDAQLGLSLVPYSDLISQLKDLTTLLVTRPTPA